VGGDGTARDICEAVDGRLPAIGVPAGVKIHSAVYAVTPRAAGEVAALFLLGEAAVSEAEVMDIDEEAFRDSRLSARLYGHLRVPRAPARLQGSKEASRNVEEDNIRALANEIVETLSDDVAYVWGPGGTVAGIAEHLGFEKTLLGVDVTVGRRLVARDAGERQILEAIRGRKARIIVTVIGGQGFIFGRGNQQISPSVIRAVGRENVTVVATPEKLAGLPGGLLVDTGDPALDRELSGWTRVLYDYARSSVHRVRAG
jgi:predicted polyphosphate/ATP-dependent NAD kinase